MKRVAAVILIFVMLLSLASCDDGSGGSFYFPLSASPSTLDPQFAEGRDAKIIINNCFEGLTRIDSDNRVSPGVAESWSVSDDGLTYTFKLREDACWSVSDSGNGKTIGDEDAIEVFDIRVTAYDFVFAFRRAVKPETSCPDVSMYYVIKNAKRIFHDGMSASNLGVSALDDYTLVITLESTCVDFLERLAESPFMPCNEDFFNLTGGRYGLSSEYLLCNGPFFVSYWDSQASLTAKRSLTYSGESRVSPSFVYFYFNSDSRDISEKLRLGAYSAAVFTSYALAPDSNVTVERIEDSVYGFCFNCEDEVFSNENLRLALCSCIKRSDFDLPEAMSGFYKGVVPPCCTAGELNYDAQVSGQLPTISYSAEKAAACWSTGLKQLGKASVSVTLLCLPEYDGVMRSLLQGWQQTMGISLGVSVEAVEETVLEQRLARGDYQLAFAPVHSSSSTASGFLSGFVKGREENIFNLDSPEYEEIIAGMMSVDSQQDILNGCYTAESYLINHAVFFPVYSSPTCFVQAQGVEDIYCSASGDNVFFQWAKRYD